MTNSRLFRVTAFMAIFAAAIMALLASPAAQTMGQPEHFVTTAIDMNTGWTGRIEIAVNRWTTPGEREALLGALFKDGQDELLDKLRDMRPVGRIYTPGSIGYDLRFAEQQTLPDGGKTIVLATDRPMSFWELTNQPRSAQYPFTWAQLTVKADGTGEGRLAVRARVFGDRPNRPIEVEHYEIQPIKLTIVETRVGTE